jgi:hypothetical protein
MTKFITRLLLVCLLSLAASDLTNPTPADAGQVLLRSAGMEDPPSAAAPRTTRTGTNHKYVTVDFPGTGSEVCTVAHWMPFTDYTVAGDWSMDFNLITTGTSANNSIWRVDIGCVQSVTSNGCISSGNPRACCSGSNAGNCHNYDTITLSPGTNLTFAFLGDANVAQFQFTNAANSFDETGCASDRPVIMKVCRNPANAGDTNTDEIRLISARPRW